MENAGTALIEYGLLGIVALVLGWAYWQERKTVNSLHEKRHEDGKEFLTAMQASTRAIETLTEVVRERSQ